MRLMPTEFLKIERFFRPNALLAVLLVLQNACKECTANQEGSRKQIVYDLYYRCDFSKIWAGKGWRADKRRARIVVHGLKDAVQG